MAAVSAVMIGLAATGYGAAAEALGFVLLAVGAAFAGRDLLAGIIELIQFFTTVDDAKSEEDLKACGKLFGDAVAKIGVDGLFFALSMFGLKKASARLTTRTVVNNGLNSRKWQGEKHKAKLCQKDRDARWTKKQSRSYFGYKDHVKTDVKSKFIVEATVTAAHVHDSQEVEHLTKKGDTILYGDSAYSGERIEKILKKIEGRICERGYSNKPRTQEQKERNRAKSKIRARIEHGERFYDEYDERYIGENDRISTSNIVNNNDEPYI